MASSVAPRLQVVLSVVPDVPLVLGVPTALRAAHALVDVPVDRFIFVTGSIAALTGRWNAQLRALPWTAVSSPAAVGSALAPTSAVLVLDPEGMPEAGELRAFLGECRRRAAPTAWLWSGRTVAVYYPAGRSARRSVLGRSSQGVSGSPRPVDADFHGERLVADVRAWYDLRDPKDVERAEHDLVRSLRKDTDGYVARLDRGISIPVSLALTRTAITPNAVTASSLLVGLLGAGVLAVPAYGAAIAGALLLWCSCILDGCDGEVARLRLLSTPWGARFDAVTDNVVHVAVFLALPVHLHLSHAHAAVIPAGLVLIAGVLLSMASVWWLILRQPSPRRGPGALLYERVASRDFIYVLLALAVVHRLEWFLWAAAGGSHVFWLTLWALARRRR